MRKKKSHEMSSLKAFAESRKARQAIIRKKQMKTRMNWLGKSRKGYSICEIKSNIYLTTYQINIYLRNTDNLEEAERNAEEAIKAIREKLGNIV
jgi:hypothetical protein